MCATFTVGAQLHTATRCDTYIPAKPFLVVLLPVSICASRRRHPEVCWSNFSKVSFKLIVYGEFSGDLTFEKFVYLANGTMELTGVMEITGVTERLQQQDCNKKDCNREAATERLQQRDCNRDIWN